MSATTPAFFRDLAGGVPLAPSSLCSGIDRDTPSHAEDQPSPDRLQIRTEGVRIDACICAALFIENTPRNQVQAELRAADALIESGPVSPKGATGPIVSVYVRDPKGSPIEIANRI